MQQQYPFTFLRDPSQVDNFFIEAVDVGFMQKLTISHDNSGGC